MNDNFDNENNINEDLQDNDVSTGENTDSSSNSAQSMDEGSQASDSSREDNSHNSGSEGSYTPYKYPSESNVQENTESSKNEGGYSFNSDGSYSYKNPGRDSQSSGNSSQSNSHGSYDYGSQGYGETGYGGQSKGSSAGSSYNTGHSQYGGQSTDKDSYGSSQNGYYGSQSSGQYNAQSGSSQNGYYGGQGNGQHGAYNNQNGSGQNSYYGGQSNGRHNDYNNQNSQSPGSSYTWSNPNNQQGYYKQSKVKEKKKGNRTGLKILAVMLCCILASGATLGVFVGLIQNGVVAIDGGSSSSSNPAFTINKVVQSGSEVTTPMGDGVTELTPQEIAEKLIPSVVCIQVYSNNAGGLSGFGGFGGQQEDGVALEPSSQGSGIIYTDDGYIITNAHVVSGASNIKVITSDGMTYEAELIGSDTVTDLAVVKIDTDAELTPAEFGSSEDLKVADSVMAIGNPGGLEFNSTVTMGYVSALDREVTDSSTGYSMECIQTDAAINPGNSGGALVNMYGQVVGVNSSKIVATGYEGLGFAIPIDTVQPIVTDLMANGYVKDRAMLGISGQFVDEVTARFYGLKTGMYVAQIASKQAQESGLKVYDVITAIDDQQVVSLGSISTYMLTKKPGDTVKLTVYRSETEETLNLELVLTESNHQE